MESELCGVEARELQLWKDGLGEHWELWVSLSVGVHVRVEVRRRGGSSKSDASDSHPSSCVVWETSHGWVSVGLLRGIAVTGAVVEGRGSPCGTGDAGRSRRARGEDVGRGGEEVGT